MVAHRRTPGGSTLVLPRWFFVLSGLVSLVAAVALAVLVVRALDDGSTPQATGSPTAQTPAPTSDSSTPPTTDSPAPTPSTSSPSPSASPTAAVDRAQYPVAVLNGTTVPGLASAASARVQQIGWPSAGVGNFRGAAPATTIYYPAGQEAAARLLAADLGVGSVAPAPTGISQQRLTVVVLSRLG